MITEKQLQQKKKGGRMPVGALLYHSDWNWLMPVVEKINEEKTGAAINMNSTETFLHTSDNEMFRFNIDIDTPKINTVWKAVIQFIQWYNKESKI